MNDALSEHPLFRTLVLMGGALALSCGGVARSESGLGEAGAPTSNGGGGSAGAPTTLAGAPSVGGSSEVVDAGPPLDAECPFPQWDCSKSAPACYRDISHGLAATGCFCNRARPATLADCSPNEVLLCQQGYVQSLSGESYRAGTWDGSVHIQCSCFATSIPASAQLAYDECLKTFPAPQYVEITSYLPPEQMCDVACTATSADVLRQDGIMCGCAPTTLK